MSELFRIEKDFLGERQVPIDAYYGVQTLRAIENFPITGYGSTRRLSGRWRSSRRRPLSPTATRGTWTRRSPTPSRRRPTR